MSLWGGWDCTDEKRFADCSFNLIECITKVQHALAVGLSTESIVGAQVQHSDVSRRGHHVLYPVLQVLHLTSRIDPHERVHVLVLQAAAQVPGVGCSYNCDVDLGLHDPVLGTGSGLATNLDGVSIAS